MAVVVNQEQKRIGLALSGGGFRAAAFHLGVYHALDRLGLLDKIDLLSCVSGGSIAGGTLALHWQAGKGLAELETYLRTKSVAVSSVIGGLIDPFHSRLDKLADTYARDLFGQTTLDQLAAGPRIYFNTTNLATGNLFFFAAGGGAAAEMGEHELGVGSAAGFAVSRAVAASSAFPPVFPPLLLTSETYKPAGGVEYVTLTDGGVYDNMGVSPLLLARNKLDYMIVSDGGMPFATEDRPTESGAMVLRAALNIMMEQIRGLEFDRMKHRHLAALGPTPLWFSIDSREGEAEEGDALFASAVGTNLERLNDRQMTVLMRHGAALVEARLRKYAPEMLGA
jgi:NTE family protein